MSSSSCLKMPSVGQRGNHSPAQILMDEWNRLEESAERTQEKEEEEELEAGYVECIS